MLEHIQRVKGIAGDAPARCGIVKPGQGVGHGIQVGGNMQAVEFVIVPGVDDDGQALRREDFRQPQGQLGPADAAGEGQRRGRR